MIYTVLNAQSINIDVHDVLTAQAFSASTNKEEDIRNKLIEIIRKNTSVNTVVDLISLKNLYETKLINNGIDGITQILKNTIGSNKDNKTHLLRNKNIDWYYVENSFCVNGLLNVSDQYRKPIPIPSELERSRIKHYYVFYSNDFSDSSTLNSSMTDHSIIEPVSPLDDIDFESIKDNKKDYLSDFTKAKMLGDIGEKYVFEIEKQYLLAHSIKKPPVWVSQKSDKYGFDIQSYRVKGTLIEKIYIEVKTTSGGLDQTFYVSENEYKKSTVLDMKYYVYRVFYATDSSTIAHMLYKGSFDSSHFLKLSTQSVYSFKVI